MTNFVKGLLLKAFKVPVLHSFFSRNIARGVRWMRIPLLRETDSWIAFCHPTPAYPVHIVILPKKPWKDWLAVTTEDPKAFTEFVSLTQTMIRDFELTPAGYRLIMNGGSNQTFPHLHFHLVAGEQLPSQE